MNQTASQLDDLQNRIQDLETRSAFQEDTVNQLNTVIIEQQQMIDHLNIVVEALRGAIQISAAEDTAKPSVLDDLPPHY